MKLRFLEVFRWYIDFYRKTRKREEIKEPETIQHYENKYCLIADFLFEKEKQDILPKHFTTELCDDFFNWLIDRPCKHNYAVRAVKQCIAVLKHANKEKIIKCQLPDFGVKKHKPKEPTYLSPDQIKAFEEYKSYYSMKQKAADLFVLQIHTGFDFGDFSEISRGCQFIYKGRKYLIKQRHKGRKKDSAQQVIPMNPVIERILEKYNFNLSILNNASYNEYIKKVADDLGIEIYLCCKDGRKIFFMNKLNNEGFTLEAASKMGGHKRVRTTEDYYAKVNINLINNELNRLGL